MRSRSGRSYEIRSTRGAVVWTDGPLIFNMRGGSLWIGTDEHGGICSLSERQTEKLLVFLNGG